MYKYIGFIVVMCFAMTQVQASGFRVPYYFTAGTPISSQEMNTNFEAIDRQFTDVVDKRLTDLEKALQEKEKRIRSLEKQLRELRSGIR